MSTLVRQRTGIWAGNGAVRATPCDTGRGIGVTLFVNWAVKPFSMALLGWVFIGFLFRPYLPADQIDSYIAGLIILAAAPCTAMVFVWSNLTKGEPHFTLSQVAVNDVIMVFAFAPIVGLLLGLSAIKVPWATLVLSVVLYIVVPVIGAQMLRGRLLVLGGKPALGRFLSGLQPLSLIALLAHTGAALWLSGRADPRSAAGHRPLGGAHSHSGLFQRWPGLPAQSHVRRTALRCWTVCADRRLQLL
jgi:hypothetical protein